MKTKIILAGGSGFLGSVLADYFAAKGMEVVILTRNPKHTGGFDSRGALGRRDGR